MHAYQHNLTEFTATSCNIQYLFGHSSKGMYSSSGVPKKCLMVGHAKSDGSIVREARHVRGSGSSSPRKVFNFRPSEVVSGAF